MTDDLSPAMYGEGREEDLDVSASLDDVIATKELDQRPARQPDYALQAHALDKLAEALADQPQDALQRLTDTMVRLLNADSAGISLMEAASTGVSFRWVAISGDWADRTGGTMPFDASPCGTVVTRDAAQLFVHPERHFRSDENEEVAELLLVPFRLDGKPIGTLWALAQATNRKFDSEDVRLLLSLARFASAAFKIMRSAGLAETAGQVAGQRAAERDLALRVSREAEERLQLAMASVGQGAWELDLTNMTLKASALMRQLVDWPDDEDIAFEQLVAVLHAEDREAFQAMLAASLASGELFETALRIVQPQDAPRWIHIRAKPFFSEDGNPLRLLGISSDVTVRQQAQRSHDLLLRLSDGLRPLGDADDIMATASSLLGAELRAGQVSYAEADPSGEFVVINREWNEGSIPTNARQHRLEEFGPEFITDLKGGVTIVIGDVASDWRTNSAVALATFERASIKSFLNVPLVKRGKLVAVLAVHSRTSRSWSADEVVLAEEVADRTWAAIERARAEAATRDSEARYRDLFYAAQRKSAELEAVLESMPDAVYIGGIDGITLANQSALDQLGFASRDDLNRHIATLAREIQTCDPVTGEAIAVEDQAFTRALNGERVVEEVRVRHLASGHERFVRCAAAPVIIDGKVIAAVAVNTDITNVKNAEDNLRASESRLQVLVHELQHRTRNLMGIVRTTAAKTVRGSADLADFESRFKSRIDALARVQGLLSRVDDHNRVTLDELLISELDALDAPSDRITLTGTTGIKLRSGAVQMLAMAFHELATNALKHGALGQADATLSVIWTLNADADDDHHRPVLTITWQENGVVMAPSSEKPRRGQGRTLIERALPYQLRAETGFTLTPDGLRCVIVLPDTVLSKGEASDA